MKNFVAFQAQLASIMEVLAKAAVSEIGKLVEDGSVVMRLEVSRSRTEIDSLRRSLHQVERELRTAREAAAAAAAAARERRSVGVQVEDQFGGADGGLAVAVDDAGRIRPFEQKHFGEEWDPLASDASPAFGFAVKTELEDELVANQMLDRTGGEHDAGGLDGPGSEHGAGGLDGPGSEYAMYEGDSQLWASFTPGDDDITDDEERADPTEAFPQTLSVHSPPRRPPASAEVSGRAPPSLGNDAVPRLDHGVITVKEEAGGRRPYGGETGGARQTDCGQPIQSDRRTSPLLGGPSGWRTGTAHAAVGDPISLRAGVGWRRGGVGGGAAAAGTKRKTFGCAQCEKSFGRSVDLERHRRSHTGEKPFGCGQCGKRFSLRCNLLRHERVHTGSRPLGCAHCGKRFAPGTNLRAHQRIHTGERPYRCDQCGRDFIQLGSLRAHQKVHSRDEPPFGTSCT